MHAMASLLGGIKIELDFIISDMQCHFFDLQDLIIAIIHFILEYLF